MAPARKMYSEKTQKICAKIRQNKLTKIDICNLKKHRFTKVMQFVIEDWLFLALLGIIMAILSLGMDFTIDFFQNCHVAIIEFANKYTHFFFLFVTKF